MELRVKDAAFVAAAAKTDQLPPEGAAEIAFAGRSNVGKSSLMNMLLQRKSLVRTSKTPGCTRAINFFSVKIEGVPDFFLVDLPGYGFAARSKEEREAWSLVLGDYMNARTSLKAVCVLVDARRGVEEDDEGLIDLAVTRGLLTVVVATKIDKVPRAQRKPFLQTIQKSVREAVIGVSSVTGEGREELLSRLLSVARPNVALGSTSAGTDAQ